MNPTTEMIEAADKVLSAEFNNTLNTKALTHEILTAALALLPGEPVGETGVMPGSNGGFSMAAFKASDVPIGTKLYASPAPQPVSVDVDILANEIRHIPGWHQMGAGALAEALLPSIRSALSSPVEGETEKEADIDTCPVCSEPLKANDLCYTDIELGVCHAACLEGSPTVNLDTGEQVDGPIPTYRYGDLTSSEPEEIQIENNLLNENDGLRAEIEALRGEIGRISGDYVPDHDRYAPLALQEMRDALSALVDNPGTALQIDTTSLTEIEALRVENGELREALQNIMGCYDNPLSRRKFPPDDFMNEALETARAALQQQQGEGK